MKIKFSVGTPELENAIVSNHYFLYELNDEIVEPEFLAFYIGTGKPTADIQGFVKGSHNYASIKPEHFLELELPVPSLVDQRQLVELSRKVADLKKFIHPLRKR
jgi:type I restriction enzyme, S subunit